MAKASSEAKQHFARNPLTCPVDSCRQEIVQVLPSNTVEDLESNVERTVQWYKQVMCQVR